jgi:hypothetical protein
MKTVLSVAALAAALALPASPLRAEEGRKPEAAKEAPSGAPAETPPKPDKPKRPEGAPAKPAPHLKPGDKPAPRVAKPAAKPGSAEMRTWLGISTHPVDPSLREHLEIQEGFGIQVVEVMPDSPAAKAGLRGNDVLVRLDDQRLISPEHLSVLVRSMKRCDAVSLTLVRKGREETVEVVLGEAEENLFGPMNPGVAPFPGLPLPPFPHRMPDPSKWQEQIRKQQDEILRQQKEWMQRHHQQFRHGQNQPGDARKSPDKAPAKPEGRPPSVRVSPGFPLRVFGTEGVLKIDNEQGELTLTRKDERHHLVVEDASGKVVYDGAFDPAKGVEGLPEEARKQLEAMKLGDLEIRLPDAPGTNPEKTVEPKRDEGKPGELL